MSGLGFAALSLACVLAGGGMISTALYNRAEYDTASFICALVLGLFLVAAGVLFFIKLALPELKDGRMVKNELNGLLKQDQAGKEDADSAERLISEFRKKYSDFFSAGHVGPNDPIQSSVTQIFWHILTLQKRRMEKAGVTMEFKAQRKKYGGKSLQKSFYFDDKYAIIEVDERIFASRTYKNSSGKTYKKRDSELAHYCIARSRSTTSRDRIICPNCGSETTLVNLLDGCDFCGTRFTVEALGNRVNDFVLRDDYEVAYDKYLDARRHFGTWALLAGAAVVGIVSLIGTISVWNTMDAGIFMKTAAVIFVTAGLAVLGGLLAKYASMFLIFPLLDLFQSVRYHSKRALEAKKQRESRNGSIAAAIKRSDPLFSKECFFSNVQNKLAAIHYAESAKEVQAFALTDIGGYLERYKNLIDTDVKDIELTDYSKDDRFHRVDMRLDLDLLDSSFKRRREKVELQLVKSLSCRTEKVCAPSVFTCKNCGNSVTLLNGGRCEYCDSTLDLWEHDWVISKYRLVK